MSLEEQILGHMKSIQERLIANKTLRGPAYFDPGKLAEFFGTSRQSLDEAMKGMEAHKAVHKNGHNWGLGPNPWGGQRKQKIFKCQHCGQSNTVDITGD